ncbi:MAG: DUF721 domain-containing protein [Pirellulales bacterium]|nr:DUF721 domain-containing protein [Pirellulales bacterium]
MADALGELLARRGFARVHSTEALEAAWREVAGPGLAEHTRLCGLKRGRLEIMISNSVLLQEMSYRKQELLEQMITAAPDAGVQELKFKIGPIR